MNLFSFIIGAVVGWLAFGVTMLIDYKNGWGLFYKDCACGNYRDKKFTHHSKYECANERIGIMKAGILDHCPYCNGKCGCHSETARSIVACGCPFSGPLKKGSVKK